MVLIKYNNFFKKYLNKLMGILRKTLRIVVLIFDVLLSLFFLSIFFLYFFLLFLLFFGKNKKRNIKNLLYIGYTGLDQAQKKGLLNNIYSFESTYNPSKVLNKITILIPFGKHSLVKTISSNISFIELSIPVNFSYFYCASQIIRLIRGCLESRRQALLNDIVMVGGPNIASIPALFARLTTRIRFILFIEAFWEDILPLQLYMSRFQKKFWYYWYFIVYKTFDAYIGGPSFRPNFYVNRGMNLNRIWPYIHQIDSENLELSANAIKLPSFLQNLSQNCIVTVSRLEQYKLIESCIDVAKILSQKSIEFKMIIIGEGREKDKLNTQIFHANLEDKVILAGAQPNEVAYAVLRNAQCCFAPYMGTALIESLLAGCAVVAFDNEPHRAIAGDGPVIFVPNGSTIDAANALEKLLINPDLLMQYQTKSRSYAWNKWNAEDIAKAYIAPMVGIR